MKNGKDNEEKVLYMPIFMSIGISIGVAIGAAIGNIPVCMCMGVCIGVCLGAGLDAYNKNKSDSQENDVSNNEKGENENTKK